MLAFTAEQFKLRGIGVFSHALAIREQARNPGLPVLAMLGEAKKIAREAVWVPEIDWRDYLGLPAQAARDALNIAGAINLSTSFRAERETFLRCAGFRARSVTGTGFTALSPLQKTPANRREGRAHRH